MVRQFVQGDAVRRRTPELMDEHEYDRKEADAGAPTHGPRPRGSRRTGFAAKQNRAHQRAESEHAGDECRSMETELTAWIEESDAYGERCALRLHRKRAGGAARWRVRTMSAMTAA